MDRNTIPCATCFDRIYHLDDCALRTNGEACDCGLYDPTGKEWACDDCDSRPFHLSDCSIHNDDPELGPVGGCSCGKPE